jgi:hypothetical protein
VVKFGGGVVVEQQPKKKRGSGAPPGNMNALKHGRNSKQLAELGALLASDPTVRATLLGIGRRKSLKEQKATEVAAHLLTNLLAHAGKKARGQLNLHIPTDVLKSIAEAADKIDSNRYAPDTKLRQNGKTTPNPTRPPKINDRSPSPLIQNRLSITQNQANRFR